MTMPGRGTPLKCFRITDTLWKRFAVVAKANGTDRTKLLVAFVRWYLRVPGVELPERPASPPHDRDGLPES